MQEKAKSDALVNLDALMGGAITQRFNHALVEALSNVRDLNTHPTKPRKITLTVTIKPDEDRDITDFSVEAKFAPVPRRPVTTKLLIGENEFGEIIAKELNKQIPGQLDVDGSETTQRVAKLTALK